jgi:lipopolysaccharide/colanic/teichoic acid biosynthesis glycosyltransferase
MERAYSFRYQVEKRLLDILFALLFLSPCLLAGTLVAVLVRCSSRGPVFYCESRLGRSGKPFQIWKFRTMYTGEERQRRLKDAQHTELDFRSFHKRDVDPRITPVGRILRRWSLDELPQLINVLSGEMSMIGPRPIIAAESKLYGEDFPFYCAVRPGLSGLWQVSGRSNLSYSERVKLDRTYVHNWSLAMDLEILLKTIPTILKTDGAY